MKNRSSKKIKQGFLDQYDSAFENDSELTLEIKELDQRYSHESYLTEGGMKELYSINDQVVDRELIKAKLKDGESPLKVDAFIREARLNASLQHPNIVPVYDIGLDENDEIYFTMKKLGGENLKSILEKFQKHDPETLETYSQTLLLDTFLKVCDAISYSHSKNILHLDLKPANIQVDEYGQVMVCDWGLARELEDLKDLPTRTKTMVYGKKGLELTQDGLFKGSPGYMAPEQISSSFGPRTKATDVYSLGAILYSLVTLEIPIEGDDLEEVYKRTEQGDFLEPRERTPERLISSSLNAVIMKAMATQAEDRYKNVQELSFEIRALSAGYATEAEEASFITQLKLLVLRNKQLSGTIMSFSLALIVFLSLFMKSLKDERNLARQAEIKASQSEKLARESLHKAEEEEKRAQELLAGLEQEKRVRQLVSTEAAPKIMESAYAAYAEGQYKKALYYMDSVVKLNPELDWPWAFRGRLLFGEMRFKEALENLDKYKGKRDITWLKDLTRQCIKDKNAGKVSWKYMLNLIKTLRKTPRDWALRSGTHTHLCMTVTRTYPVEDRLKFAKEMFQTYSVENRFRFDLSRVGNFHKLSMRNSKGFRWITPLHNLPLVDLDLAYTGVTDLRPLKNMPLIKLDLENTSVRDISVLKGMPLKNLNLRHSDVSVIKALENSSLERLSLSYHWTELEPLKTCKNLNFLRLPRDLYSESELKKYKLLDKVEYYKK